jgi:hypothetical protein
MRHRNGIFTGLAAALSSIVLAGMVYTDDYKQAAQAEASGYDALFRRVAGGAAAPCDQAPRAVTP